MKVKTGVDIVDIRRVQKNFDALLTRIATEAEQKYVREMNAAPWVRLAGLFAAKESLFKALRRKNISYRDVIIGHDALGAPVVIFSDSLQAELKKEGLKSMDVSISHEKDGFAIAQCVLLFESINRND